LGKNPPGNPNPSPGHQEVVPVISQSVLGMLGQALRVCGCTLGSWAILETTLQDDFGYNNKSPPAQISAE